MANEFQHKDPGTALTQAEFIASDGTGHIFDSQAAGDILYASSTTVLARLAKATDGNVLELASGLPAWTASPTIGSTSWANANHAHAASNSGGTLTTLGTVTTGVWQGTAIASAYIAADAITGAKIADDAIDSEHYTDGSIDNAHLADDAVDSDEIAAGAIDTAHIADNQVTVAKIEDIARGSIIYGNASAASAELTKGSANYVLTSDGTDIAWAAAAGGGSLTFIATAVASNDATLGVSGIDSTYDTYLIVGSDLVPASNDQDLFFRLGDSGGIDSGASDYEWSMQRFYTGGTTFAAKSSTSSAYIQIAGNDTIGGVGNASGEGAGFVIWLPMPSDATMKPGITGSSTYVNGSGTGGGSTFYGQRDAVITTTQAEIHFASGNVSTGRLTLWGLKHS